MIVLLKLFGRLLAVLPEAVVRLKTGFFAAVIYGLIPRRRRAILSHLHHAFPGREHAWYRSMAWRSCWQTVETALLALAYPFFSEKRIRAMLVFEADAQQAMDSVVATGQPAVLCAPHLGAWELMTALPLVYPGELPPIGVIFRPLKNPALNHWVVAARERFGLHLLSRRDGFSAGMKIMRGGGYLTLLFDQNGGRQGSLITFFDRVASATELVGLLAEKFTAQPVMTYTRRLGFWRYRMVIEPLSGPTDSAAVTWRVNRWLEALLKSDEAVCASWLWLHDRWRTQHEPDRRFRIDAKRNLLPTDRPLPRATRFWIRLPNWLGDIVMVLPLLRALRAGRPDAALTLVVKPAFIPLLRQLGLAEDFVPLPARGLGYFAHFHRLRRRYPDTYLLFTNSARGDLEAALTRCPQRFGMERPGKRRPMLTHRWSVPADADRTRRHQTREWEEMLRHFGLREAVDLSPLCLPGTAAAKAPLPAGTIVGLICGTENFPAKRWPAAHFQALIRQLSGRYPEITFALFGTAGDRPITDAVAGVFPAGRVIDLAGLTDLPTFAAALTRCRVVVTNDTGGMHLANAFGVPVAALFGPTNPRRTGPVYNSPARILQPRDCPPTGGGDLAALAPETVAAAVAEMLDATDC